MHGRWHIQKRLRRNAKNSTRFKLVKQGVLEEHKMKKILIALFMVSMATNIASAACWGSESFQNCSDSYGNSYNVTRTGNSTYVSGYNANTGSSWSSNSMTVGNSTYQSGYDSDGNSWNQTINNYGGTTTYSGSDSDGNSFYRTCSTNWDGSRSCY